MADAPKDDDDDDARREGEPKEAFVARVIRGLQGCFKRNLARCVASLDGLAAAVAAQRLKIAELEAEVVRAQKGATYFSSLLNSCGSQVPAADVFRAFVSGFDSSWPALVATKTRVLYVCKFDALPNKVCVARVLTHHDSGTFNDVVTAVQVCHGRPKKVVAVLAVQTVQRPVVVMEWCRGGNLERYVEVHGLSAAEAVDVGRDIVEGVLALQEMDLYHLDLHPRNILLRERDRHRAGPATVLQGHAVKRSRLGCTVLQPAAEHKAPQKLLAPEACVSDFDMVFTIPRSEGAPGAMDFRSWYGMYRDADLGALHFRGLKDAVIDRFPDASSRELAARSCAFQVGLLLRLLLQKAGEGDTAALGRAAEALDSGGGGDGLKQAVAALQEAA